MKNSDLRFYVDVRVSLVIHTKGIFEGLKYAVLSHAPSLKTIYIWVDD